MSESVPEQPDEQPQSEPEPEPDEGTQPESHEAEDSSETPPGVV